MKLFVFLRAIMFVSLLTATQHVYTQGCSDAGFCTVRNLKPHSDESSIINRKNRFLFSISQGGADHGIGVTGGHVEYGRTVSDNVQLDIKLSFMQQRGVSLRRSGLSDIFLSSSYTLHTFNTFTVGLKIPLSSGNTKINGLSLPMDFQSSLGTYDLIAGFGTRFEDFQLTAAFQIPLVQNNNRFFDETYPADSEFRLFTSTNDYKRSSDILVRISYPIQFNTGLVFTPSILPIYHVADDSYTTLNGTKQSIAGSQGLTVNMNMFITYSLNASDQIELSIGSPVRTRSVRPDGLTRSYVAALEYQTGF